LALGTDLAKALGERKGMDRFGNFTAPLDEALVQVVLVCPLLPQIIDPLLKDLSGRPHLSFDLDIPTEREAATTLN